MAAEKADKLAAEGVPKAGAQQQPRGAWAKGAPGDERLRKLEARLQSLAAENRALRARAVPEKEDDAMEADDEEAATHIADPELVQCAVDALVKAYGVDSPEAKAQAAKLEALRAERRLAKPVSTQLRQVERKVDRQQKALERAKECAASAAEAVRAAQATLADADAKVAAAETRLQEAEAERAAVCQRTAGAPASTAFAAEGAPAFCVLPPELAADAAAQQAVEVLRTRLAACTAPAAAGGTAAASTAGEPPLAEEAIADGDLEMDDAAIDGFMAFIQEVPEGGDAEQHAAFVAAAKEKYQSKRKEMASHILGIRRQVKHKHSGPARA